MASLRRSLRAATAALDAAQSADAWQAAADAHDALTGADAWRADDTSPHYDAAGLRTSMARMAELRASRQGLRLARVLTEDLYRHLNDFHAPELYATALGGTKHLIDRYLEEAEACLRWLSSDDVPGVPAAARLARFEIAWKVFGRSALLLSGGATWGFHHLGVVKALFAHGLLPSILSGASTGAMIAAGVCTRNDAELADMYANTDQIRLDGLMPIGARGALKSGGWLDPNQLYDVLQHNVGPRTFAEAYAHSGRALNISVSPTRRQQKPRLLTWLTAPDVLVARAALASAALPTLFPPVQLEARQPDGSVVPYIEGERWVDGSLRGDLPKLRLARLHNVNHFIVSQTNPHVVPFMSSQSKGGLRTAATGLTSATIRAQGAYAADVLQRATGQAGGALGQLADQAHALVSQDYRGDIDIHPRFRWQLFSKVVRNPTRADLDVFIAEGERSVWPRLAMIRNQTRIGRAFRDCVTRLRAAPEPSTG